jgi:hypothetical protein
MSSVQAYAQGSPFTLELLLQLLINTLLTDNIVPTEILVLEAGALTNVVEGTVMLGKVAELWGVVWLFPMWCFGMKCYV